MEKKEKDLSIKLTITVPLWLHNKLYKEAEWRGFRLGTYIRHLLVKWAREQESRD